MSDVSSMYIVYLLEFYKWANRADVVKKLWPIAKRAAEWHMSVAAGSGVPEYQCNTYDILNPPAFRQVSFNSAFHILGLQAAAALAETPAVRDMAFAEKCRSF